MEKILENIWGVFVGLGWWLLNRTTAKIDALEAKKADGDAVQELDKRVDALSYENVGRKEYKSDITALHSRVNILSDQLGRKQDTIKTIRIEKDSKGK